MKTLIVWSVCFVLGGGLMAQDGNEAANKNTTAATAPVVVPAVQLVLELSDGSRVIGTPAIDRLKIATQYASLEVQLSLMLMIEFSGTNHAAKVILQNGDSVDGQLAATEIAVKTNSGRVVTPLAGVSKIRIRMGSHGGDFVNSLGMEFVFVPGTKVLFSIWDTRVQDYRAYAEANPGVWAGWKNPGFEQGDDHPVVMVNWGEAKAFCAWLTQKERKEGKIGQDQEYRLPTDAEWSAAVGPGKYPWGDQWPPPKGAGNYAPSFKTDDYECTSPVGSFKANQYGLYDMGGNVWQWCEDLYRSEMNEKVLLDKYFELKPGAGQKYRVARGSCWSAFGPEFMLSSARFDGFDNPAWRRGDFGFRCVLVSGAASR